MYKTQEEAEQAGWTFHPVSPTADGNGSRYKAERPVSNGILDGHIREEVSFVSAAHLLEMVGAYDSDPYRRRAG